MAQNQFIEKCEFDRVRNCSLDRFARLNLLAKMHLLNTLFEVKRAGSGHLGSSFSAMDIVNYLYECKLNIVKQGINHPNRDIYFSSKGHDAPGLYAVLYSHGIVSEEKFLSLRRLGGLDGHPDVGIPGCEANTGSLGMGISKARGIAFAKRYNGNSGHVYVLVGDGEFQEGQNFEALQSTVQQGAVNLTVIMDHNKLQSDRLVQKIVSLGNLEAKIASFGWYVARCDGHDYKAIEDTLEHLSCVVEKPKFLICDTVKGKGISFMEHPRALAENGDIYKWHSGAPDDEAYKRGFEEILSEIGSVFKQGGLGDLRLKAVDGINRHKAAVSKVSSENIAMAYGETLVALADVDSKFLVLDADLSADCKLRDFETRYPHRFIEMGIAEQDMVSMACGLAGKNLLPICNSFANFLAARANEQIYNAMSEGRKIIFACHYAGFIPAGPGKSHQAIRDISLFASLPNVAIIQACNSQEIQWATRWAISDAPESVAIRINIGPSPRKIQLPDDYRWQVGRGAEIVKGNAAVVFAYGPVLLHEVLIAAELLREEGINISVINMPWMNRFDWQWLQPILRKTSKVIVVEDHSPTCGLADHLMSIINTKGWPEGLMFKKVGVVGYPACGSPWEVLKFHGLDGESLSERIRSYVNGRQSEVELGIERNVDKRRIRTYSGLDEQAQL